MCPFLVRWCLTRSDNGIGGVDTLVAEKKIENVYDISRLWYCLMMITFTMDNNIITVLSCCSPKVGLENTVNHGFYGLLHSSVTKMRAAETLVICSDINNHVRELAIGYEGKHGGYDYGLSNTEAQPILKFAVAQNLVVGNSHFNTKE